MQLDLFANAALAAYRHPAANRSTLLDGHPVAYLLKRARRRSIGFVIGPDGLSVHAPTSLKLAELDAALQAKRGWIVRKLHEQAERGARLQAARVDWRDGLVLPYLGAPLRIEIDVGTQGVALQKRDDGDRLRVGVAAAAGPAALRVAVRHWLQREAGSLFQARCQHHMPRLGVRCTRLGLSSARTRWGSASASGAIRLNWRLIHFALPVIDYVVVHELAHLKEMNHGPRFWAIVEAALPDHHTARRVLREQVLPLLD